MIDSQAFLRHVCQAKASEQVGELNAAIGHLDLAVALTHDNERMWQLTARRKRLESSISETKENCS